MHEKQRFPALPLAATVLARPEYANSCGVVLGPGYRREMAATSVETIYRLRFVN
jgi:hypothetical protein